MHTPPLSLAQPKTQLCTSLQLPIYQKAQPPKVGAAAYPGQLPLGNPARLQPPSGLRKVKGTHQPVQPVSVTLSAL